MLRGAKHYEEDKHIAFAYGYTLAQLEAYARDNGIPQSTLTPRVAQLLLGSGQGSTNSVPILQTPTTGQIEQLPKVAVARRPRSKPRLTVMVPCPVCEKDFGSQGLHLHISSMHGKSMKKATAMSREVRSKVKQ